MGQEYTMTNTATAAPTAVRERPLAFRPEMILALLNTQPGVWPAQPIDPGKPFKYQTRRVMKPQPIPDPDGPQRLLWQNKRGQKMGAPIKDAGWWFDCPYGRVGDHLWARERALYWTGGEGGTSDVAYSDDPDLPHLLQDNESIAQMRQTQPDLMRPVGSWKWRSGMFMPRWAARLTFELMSVRVERLQDIATTQERQSDIIAEGTWPITWSRVDGHDRLIFRKLWDSVNGKQHPWNANPWVWVLELKRLT